MEDDKPLNNTVTAAITGEFMASSNSNRTYPLLDFEGMEKGKSKKSHCFFSSSYFHLTRSSIPNRLIWIKSICVIVSNRQTRINSTGKAWAVHKVQKPLLQSTHTVNKHFKECNVYTTSVHIIQAGSMLSSLSALQMWWLHALFLCKKMSKAITSPPSFSWHCLLGVWHISPSIS